MWKTKKEIVKFLSSQLKQHVNENWGMTNSILNDLAETLCPRLYAGMYAPHQLKSSRLRTRTKPYTLIVNVGNHFVSIYVSKTVALYVDSYGMRIFRPKVREFLKSLEVPVFFNDRQLQSGHSKYCGLYALLFCMYFECYSNRSMQTYFNFHKLAGPGNDRLCIAYIKKLIKRC